MAQPIEFFFDFSSPYGYLTAQVIEDFGKRYGREIAWKPFLLGALFQVTGQKPLLDMPVKGDYARKDLQRSARSLGQILGSGYCAVEMSFSIVESGDELVMGFRQSSH